MRSYQVVPYVWQIKQCYYYDWEKYSRCLIG